MTNLESMAREALALAEKNQTPLIHPNTAVQLAQGYLDLLAENQKLDQKVLRLHGRLSEAHSDNAKLSQQLTEANVFKSMLENIVKEQTFTNFESSVQIARSYLAKHRGDI